MVGRSGRWVVQVDHGRKELERIRLHERELLQKRVALARVAQQTREDETTSAAEHARRERLRDAERAQLDALSEKHRQLHVQSSEAALQMRQVRKAR